MYDKLTMGATKYQKHFKFDRKGEIYLTCALSLASCAFRLLAVKDGGSCSSSKSTFWNSSIVN